MDDNWEINSMIEFDHYQNIARAAFGDMLYDSDRVNIYSYFIYTYIITFYSFIFQNKLFILHFHKFLKLYNILK